MKVISIKPLMGTLVTITLADGTRVDSENREGIKVGDDVTVKSFMGCVMIEKQASG